VSGRAVRERRATWTEDYLADESFPHERNSDVIARRLGIRAVIAVSFERIHRSNLVMMGVLPLTFPDGETADSLGLDGTEMFSIDVGDPLTPRQPVVVSAHSADGRTVTFTATASVDTPIEVDYLRHSGILHMMIRDMARG